MENNSREENTLIRMFPFGDDSAPFVLSMVERTIWDCSGSVLSPGTTQRVWDVESRYGKLNEKQIHNQIKRLLSNMHQGRGHNRIFVLFCFLFVCFFFVSVFLLGGWGAFYMFVSVTNRSVSGFVEFRELSAFSQLNR